MTRVLFICSVLCEGAHERETVAQRFLRMKLNADDMLSWRTAQVNSIPWAGSGDDVLPGFRNHVIAVNEVVARRRRAA